MKQPICGNFYTIYCVFNFRFILNIVVCECKKPGCAVYHPNDHKISYFIILEIKSDLIIELNMLNVLFQTFYLIDCMINENYHINIIYILRKKLSDTGVFLSEVRIPYDLICNPHTFFVVVSPQDLMYFLHIRHLH